MRAFECYFVALDDETPWNSAGTPARLGLRVGLGRRRGVACKALGEEKVIIWNRARVIDSHLPESLLLT